MTVRAKKHLGQHFLNDLGIADKIAQSLTLHGGYTRVLEIGPGMGVLTKPLLERPELEVWAIEIDTESIDWLKSHFDSLKERLIEGDILKADIPKILGNNFAIAGNFPYNISSQILFRLLEWKQNIPECVGMFQREVGQRICASEGSKVYGILSVLLQTFYKCEYLFEVSAGKFNPPPKVESAVLRFLRKEDISIPCNERFFFQVVKTAFNQRRKTLRNALRSLAGPNLDALGDFAGKRAEQLSPADFMSLTLALEKAQKEN